MSYRIRNSCRLCASPDLEKLVDFGETPLANEYPPQLTRNERLIQGNPEQKRFPLYLVGCNACGHVQLPVVVDPKRLFPSDYPYQSGTSPVFREHLVKLATTLRSILPLDARVLDVACNDGTFVREVNAQGIVATGIDPSAPMGFIRDFFRAAWAENEREVNGTAFDCITALNVFAHVDDLCDFTRGVHTLLEPCGLFVIEVGYLPDVVKRGLFDTVYHEHMSYHHLSPLVRFFKRHGMTLVDAHRIDTQGGSIRMYVRNCDKQHQGGDDGHNEVSARLQQLLTEETAQGIWPGVRALDESRKSERKWVVSFARHHKLTGKPIAIYGAPAKLTTYLHSVGLFPDRIGLVVDDNPLKVGRYVPGTVLRIEPTSKLREYQPTGVLCASWNYAEDIKARYADLECEWYVPFEERQETTELPLSEYELERAGHRT